MNPDHAHFAEWDAAYVVGALSLDDRRAFEEHAAECRMCRDAMVELVPMVGLLARVDRDRAVALLDEDPDAGPRASARAQLVALGTRAARQRRALRWGGALAAAGALVVVAVLAVTLAIGPAMRDVQVVALEPVIDVPISATVELSATQWGTRIEMVCDYPADAEGPPEGWPYVLVVTGRDGTESELSTWQGRPGTTTRLDAGTVLDAADIASIEVRALDGDLVLLRGVPAP